MSLHLSLRFNDTELATGTGFVMRSQRGPVLITARHNFTGRRHDTGTCLSPTGGIPNAVVITHNAPNEPGLWMERRESLLKDDGSPLWFEHPQYGGVVDFVALPLTKTDVQLYFYDTAEAETDLRVSPASTISVIGFPFGLRMGGSLATWVSGFVASEPDIDLEAMPKFLIDCRTREGLSGAAVIAFRGKGEVLTRVTDGSIATVTGGVIWRLLGVYTGRIRKESDLGFVWKASAIRQLVDSLRA